MPFWLKLIDSDDIKHVCHTKIKAPTIIQTLYWVCQMYVGLALAANLASAEGLRGKPTWAHLSFWYSGDAALATDLLAILGLRHQQSCRPSANSTSCAVDVCLASTLQ